MPGMTKLRVKVGSFYKELATGQLFIVRIAYRLQSEPNIWILVLEERSSKDSPITKVSAMVDAMQGGGADLNFVLAEPIRHHYDIDKTEQGRKMYHYGSSVHVKYQRLLKDFREC